MDIESLDDPRLDPYRDLKQRGPQPSGTFIAEGEKLVRRLIVSPCTVESVLCTSAARDRLRGLLPVAVPAYIATTPLISRLIGFQFHRGVLACGRRPPPQSVESFCRHIPVGAPALLVLCPELRDPTNLGTILRTAAAFGAAGAIVGTSGVDPFSRRVLRTSMGAVLQLPIVQTADWGPTLDVLHDAGFETIATVLDASAEPLGAAPCPARAALLLGNEDAGLPATLIAKCRRRVTLPMSRGIDSLNVSVAAGIVLHHFSRNRFPNSDPSIGEPLRPPA